MPVVTVGKNAVIGIMNFVNGDIMDDVIAAGVLAKIIRYADYTD